MDENIRLDVGKLLQSQGHNIKYVAHRSTDSIIARQCQKEKSILLTCDTDFADTLKYPPGIFYGILILRIHPPRFDRFKKALINFFSYQNERLLKGKTFLIEEDSFIEIG